MPRASRGFTTGLGTAQQGGETFLQLTVHPAGAEGGEQARLLQFRAQALTGQLFQRLEVVLQLLTLIQKAGHQVLVFGILIQPPAQQLGNGAQRRQRITHLVDQRRQLVLLLGLLSLEVFQVQRHVFTAQIQGPGCGQGCGQVAESLGEGVWPRQGRGFHQQRPQQMVAIAQG